MQNPFQKFLQPKPAASLDQDYAAIAGEADAGKKYIQLNTLLDRVASSKATALRKFGLKEKLLDVTKRGFWGMSIASLLAGMAFTPLAPLVAPFFIVGGIGGLIASLGVSTVELKTDKKEKADKEFDTLAQKIAAELKDIREKTPVNNLLQSPSLPDMLKARDGAALQKRLSTAFNTQAGPIETLQQELAKKNATPAPKI